MSQTAAMTTIDEKRERLHGLIERHALIQAGYGEAIPLTSGQTSLFYFDMRPLGLRPDSAPLIGDLMSEKVKELGLDTVGGMESGAIPITAAICARWPFEEELNGFFVRKKPRDHGTGKRIEGNFKEGAKVCMIEDVCTTGGSTLKAAEVVREAGGNVAHALVIVDRGQEAKEMLAEHGITLHSLFTVEDFGV